MVSLIKTENCPQDLIALADKITFDYLQGQHNRILCDISEKLLPGCLPPRMYFAHNLDTLYCLEFVPGSRQVLLKELHYSIGDDVNRQLYINYLIEDCHRVWSTSVLSCKGNADETVLSNQLLTLLRICKVDKNEYLRNTNALSNKFK